MVQWSIGPRVQRPKVQGSILELAQAGKVRASGRGDGGGQGQDVPTQQYFGSISDLPKSLYIDFILSVRISRVSRVSCVLVCLRALVRFQGSFLCQLPFDPSLFWYSISSIRPTGSNVWVRLGKSTD